MHAGFQFVLAAFFRSESLDPPPIQASSTFRKTWNGYTFAKADPGFFNSPMTGCVAIATRDLKTTCREG